MSDGTHIEWSDASWNPIRAGSREKAEAGFGYGTGWQCQRVSPGCQNCYAEAINKRLGTGLGYDAKGMAASVPFLDEKTLLQPLSWRKPRKVFVCSMTDFAGEWVADEWLDRMFAVMALTPQHTYQVLTKRPGRLREYLSDERAPVRMSRAAMLLPFPPASDAVVAEMVLWGQREAGEFLPPMGFAHWPLPNVWIGTSVEDQQRADERIPELLATPAAVRFLSCEPLLGPVLLEPLGFAGPMYGPFPGGDPRRFKPDEDTNTPAELKAWRAACAAWDRGEGADRGPACATLGDASITDGSGFGYGSWVIDPGLHWVIVGGESGPRSRPMDLAWARSLVAQCQAAGVAAFVKQLGAKPQTDYRDVGANLAAPIHVSRDYGADGICRYKLRDRKGGDMAEWPEDLRVREWPVQQPSAGVA